MGFAFHLSQAVCSTLRPSQHSDLGSLYEHDSHQSPHLIDFNTSSDTTKHNLPFHYHQISSQRISTPGPHVA